MKSRTEWLLVAGVSAGVNVLTVVPYLAAAHLAPAGTHFSGFLLNPVDGFSYLAKMNAGLQGSWRFSLPYAGVHDSGALLFLYYIGLGHLAGILGLQLLTVFHAARVLGGISMDLAVFAWLKQVVPSGAARTAAFGFVLVGSGLGWLALAAGVNGSDLFIPESIPFVTEFTNPHFPLAVALMALGMLAIVQRGRLAGRVLGAVACGFGLGLVLPLAAAPAAAAGGAWSLWELRLIRPSRGDLWRTVQAGGLLPSVGLAAGALPWVAYDVWLVSTQPDFAAWQAQNQTPSPPIWAYLAGFGWVLAWAAYGWWQHRDRPTPVIRSLLTWVVVGALLLYLPFNLQRRFSLGLFLPLAALAGLGVADRWRLPTRRGWAAYALVLLLSMPSNALVVTAGLSQVAAGNPPLVTTDGEARAYDWLSENAVPGEVILGAQATGEVLPARAPVRVVVGHPFETPNAAQRLQQVDALFGDASMSQDQVAGTLSSWDVTYVFYGPAEATLGAKPAWLAALPLAYSGDGVEIYRVSAP